MAEPSPHSGAASSSAETGRLLDRISAGWALAGGFVFCAIVIMSIISIVGRKLFAAPIQGDIELLQMGAAIGSAAFLPLCELHDQHIRVDALTTWLSDRGRSMLDTVAHGLLMLVSVLLTWRTGLYVLEAKENHELSTILLLPTWVPIAFLVPSFILLTLAALTRLIRSATDIGSLT